MIIVMNDGSTNYLVNSLGGINFPAISMLDPLQIGGPNRAEASELWGKTNGMSLLQGLTQVVRWHHNLGTPS